MGVWVCGNGGTVCSSFLLQLNKFSGVIDILLDPNLLLADYRHSATPLLTRKPLVFFLSSSLPSACSALVAVSVASS